MDVWELAVCYLLLAQLATDPLKIKSLLVSAHRQCFEGFFTASILQMMRAFLLPWECPVSLKKVLFSAESTVGALSQSYLFTVHFNFFFSSFSAVSLYPTRPTLAPLDLPQSDLSVKSDPLSLSRTNLLHAKVLLTVAKWPLCALWLTTAAIVCLLISSQ